MDDLYVFFGNIILLLSGLDIISYVLLVVFFMNICGEENLQQLLGIVELVDCVFEIVEDVFMFSRSIDLGQGFVGWMKVGIVVCCLFINDIKVLIYIVDGIVMLVILGIFKCYVYEYLEFEKLVQVKEMIGWKLV